MTNVIIFDLDGTLLYTLENLEESTNFALSKYNYAPITFENTRNFVGNGVSKLIERAIPNGITNPDFEDCLETFKNHYAMNMYTKTAPYKGIMEMLINIKQKGIKTAVVSNKFDSAVKELCKNYFGSLIDFAIGQSSTIPQKPAPDSIFRIIKYFECKIEDCILVGDSEVDIKTAKNANIPCISVSWGYRTREILEKAGAETIIDKPDEILSLLG